MAKITVGEKDYGAIMEATMAARDAGDMDLARRLDHLGGKINAALSRADPLVKAGRSLAGSAPAPAEIEGPLAFLERLDAEREAEAAPADAMLECGRTDHGACMLAGTEHCDFDCPYRDAR